MIAWALAHNAAKLRAEDALRDVGPTEDDDEAFYELVAAAFDDATAQRAMYDRLLERGRRRSARGEP